MQVIIQIAIHTATVAIMVVKEAENLINAATSVQAIPSTGSPVLKQPTHLIERWKTNTRNHETLK